MNIHSPVKIAGISFGNLVMNAAYVHSKTLEDVEALVKSDSGAIVVGSILVKARKPNPGQGYWRHKEGFYSLNSYGLPNGGMPYFRGTLPKMVELAHANGKPLIANIVGFTKEEFVELIKLAEESGADIVELNLGCPNIWHKGKQKRIISYHASLVKEVLDYIGQHPPSIKIAVKISPLPPDILGEVAQAITNSGIVQVVTATNSYPNAATTTGTNGPSNYDETLAGLAGRALKPISLGIVQQLRAVLPDSIQIIGAGGISSANDVNDYLLAGAAAVQIATALVDDGLTVFRRIIQTREF